MNDVESIVLGTIYSVTGTLSVLGSSAIISMILSDRERKLGRPYHRLMLMMSCFDVIQSLALAISPLPLPHDAGVYGAKGNSSTCTAQGFLIILGYAVTLYNAGLNIFFMLTIRYNFSSEQFAKYEPAVHTTAIIAPLSFAISFTTKDYISRIGVLCASRSNVSAIIIGVFYIVNFLICISTMISICLKVNIQTSRIRQYGYNTRRNSSNRLTPIVEQRNETRKQAFLYFLAFALTHAFSIIGLLIRGGEDTQPPFAVLILSSIFYPLQGFWNFCFYARSAVKFVMQTNPNMHIFRAVYGVIFDHTMDLGSHRARRQSLMIIRSARDKNDSDVRYQSRADDLSADDFSTSQAASCCSPTGNSMNDPTRCTPVGDRENQTKHEIKTEAKGRGQAFIEVDSVLNEEDIAVDNYLNDATPCEPDGYFENDIKFTNGNKTKDRYMSLVDVGSVLNNEKVLDISDGYLENQIKLEIINSAKK